MTAIDITIIIVQNSYKFSWLYHPIGIFVNRDLGCDGYKLLVT